MWMSIKLSVIILFLGLPYCGGSNVSNSSKINSLSERRNVSGHSLQDDSYICVSWPYRHGPLGERHLRLGYCSTYDKDTRTRLIAGCSYFQTDVFDSVIKEGAHENMWYIKLPHNMSALNDFMCGPMNRKGRVCSECKDGYGLAVLSIGFQIPCTKCTYTWYPIPLYLFMELVPITIFYFVMLIFQFNITSAPMTSYIMVCQLFAQWWKFMFGGEDFHVSRRMFMLNNHLDVYMKIMLSVYEMWNLHFFRSLVPPFCISDKLKPFHIGMLGFVSSFYPLCLIAVTWISIELHDRDFKPLVLLARPFHGCLGTLRRMDKTRDTVNVFASFFLLSFSNTMYQTYFFFLHQWIEKRSTYCTFLGFTVVTNADLTVPFFSSYHLTYFVPVLIICFVFNILPTLLLLLYPFRIFRSCLSLCKLDGPVLNTFVEKFYGCYRDGLDGGRDMRSFAAFYFFLRPAMVLIEALGNLGDVSISNNDPYFLGSVVPVLFVILLVACRPYKKTYMNVVDTLLLLHMCLFSHLISSCPGFGKHSHFVYTFFVMFSFPFVGLVLFFVYRGLRKLQKMKPFSTLSLKCEFWYQRVVQRLRVNTRFMERPLVHSASYHGNYRAIINTSDS